MDVESGNPAWKPEAGVLGLRSPEERQGCAALRQAAVVLQWQEVTWRRQDTRARSRAPPRPALTTELCPGCSQGRESSRGRNVAQCPGSQRAPVPRCPLW